MVNSPRVQVISIVDAVAHDLREDILMGQLTPGMPLTEALVAERFDVARPTAKAAIEKLVGESLLTRRTHKSARVRVLGPEDVRDIYTSREHFEAGVLRHLATVGAIPEEARAANQRIRELTGDSALEVVQPDMDFHTALVDALDSPRMSAIYRTLASEVKLCMAQVQGRNLLTTQLIAGEHARIMELVEAGDGEAAAALLHVHLGRARERLVRALGGEAGPEADLPHDHALNSAQSA